MPTMTMRHAGDQTTALCHRDGRVTVTFAYRNVPVRGGTTVVEHLLVGVCDRCGDAVVVPAQATPQVKVALARAKAPASMGANAITPLP